MSSANSFGSRFVMTSFGESHGSAVGVVIDGMPAGIPWNQALLEREMNRRKPGTSTIVSARAENDEPEILSGVYEGMTLGTPIAIIVRNHDARSGDYDHIRGQARPGHADDVWISKFGHSDPRGGGRSSGRETVARVIAGAVARMFLQERFPAIRVTGFARKIGPFELDKNDLPHAQNPDEFVARFPSRTRQYEVERLLIDAKAEGKSYGGIAEVWIEGIPANLGQPVFHKLKADLASAFMGVGATSAFELGDGFNAADEEGSSYHGAVAKSDSKYGGIRGGISSGEKIVLRSAFKPTSSVLDVAKKGRHDPCIVPRAIPVLEAMAAIVIADHVLWARGDR